MEKDPFTGKVIGCAIEVHRVLIRAYWSRRIGNVWRMNFT
jgi:hypothetical protein